MTRDELRAAQQEGARWVLYSLFVACHRRLAGAARLVGARGAAIQGACALDPDHVVNLGPLLPAWEALCGQYLADRYNAQELAGGDPKAGPEQRWWLFVYNDLLPALLEDDEVVRNILRAVGKLPCRDPQGAADAVLLYVREMPMPGRENSH